MADGGDRVVLDDGVVRLRPFEESDVEEYVRQQDDAMADGFEWAAPATVEDVEAACVLGGHSHGVPADQNETSPSPPPEPAR